ARPMVGKRTCIDEGALGRPEHRQYFTDGATAGGCASRLGIRPRVVCQGDTSEMLRVLLFGMSPPTLLRVRIPTAINYFVAGSAGHSEDLSRRRFRRRAFPDL